MPQQNVDRRPPLSAWQAEFFRLTAFPVDPPLVEGTKWWTDVVGEEPEARLLRLKQGALQEEGPFHGGKLALAVQPPRIDWVFSPAEERTPESGDLLTLGSFSDLVDLFSQTVIRWFTVETCPPIQRLAFGTTLIQPVQNRPEGYRQIALYLPAIKLDAEGSSDFHYRINRRRPSKTEGQNLVINRLSTWSVMAWGRAFFSVGAGRASAASQTSGFALRLELDINTAQDFQGQLSKEQLPGIFEELVEMGKEIAQEGDIP